MKLKKWWISSVVLGGIALVSAGCSGSDEGKVYEFDFNTSQSPTHVISKEITEPWAEKVEEETDGQIKINVNYSSGLGEADDAWDDVNGGVYDIGSLNIPYFTDTELYPLSIGTMPFAFPDNETGIKVLEKFSDKYMEDVFEDTFLGGIASTDPYAIYGTAPLNEAADFKGEKIRVGGKLEAKGMEKVGATPTSIKIEDLYTSLQRGTVDHAMFNPVGAQPIKLHEVAPYMLDLNYSIVPFLFTVNRNKLEELPDDLRTQFEEELLPEFAEKNTKVYNDQALEAKEEFAEEVGDKGEIIELDDEAEKELQGLVAPIWDDWVEEANDKGYPGDEMMDYFKELIAEEGHELPF